MPSNRKRGRKAADIRQALDPGFPLDLVVRTPEDLRWRLEEGDGFVQEVLSKGRVIYEAPDT